MGKNSFLIVSLVFFIGILFSFITGIALTNNGKETEGETKSSQKEVVKGELEYNPPSLEDVPEGPLGESIKYGHELVDKTDTALDGYVGNKLSCTSCHGNAGLDQTASLVGVTAVYPQYIPRSGKIVTIEDRINGCMVRSMNGEKLPLDSKEMKAMVSYLTYISKGVPVGEDIPWRMQNKMENPPKPNVANGEALYKQSCISCHAADGSGTGANSGPALWGPNSYNDGAGMGRLTTAAGYIKRNMPLVEMGGIGQGELTDQQAVDLAAYINSQERPKWKGRANDWPNGGAPKDVPYYNELNSVKAEKNK